MSEFVERGTRTLMRVYIGERDRWEGMPLYQALLTLFRERGLAGATVLRAVAGYGASSTVHTADLLRFSTDLPIVVEVIDSRERIEAVLPAVDTRVSGGLVTLAAVDVVVHRPH
jgi:PII-like signaling protein